jgi:hypothetical protein
VFTQPPPRESQSSHRKSNDIGVVPPQLPLFAVSVSPCTALPAIVGAETSRGADGVACTTPVGAEVARLEPSELVAVTRTRSV